MAELFVDIASRRVTGYNMAATGAHASPDSILTDDIDEIRRGFSRGEPLYYVDGKITAECPGTDGGLFGRMESVGRQVVDVGNKVNAEHRTFMCNIMGGMTVEGARDAAKADRDTLEALEKDMGGLEAGHRELSCEAAARKFEEEEAGIGYKYFLSMVAVVRDENAYLADWIRYHAEEMGFEHFYIYDNESEMPVRDYLDGIGFEHLGKVTVIPYKTTHWLQQDALNGFLGSYAKETRWFLAADPDEYVAIKDGAGTLRDFLGGHSQYATIKCLWRHYNANGQVFKTAGTDIERFTKATDWEGWKHGGKKFAQSNRVSRFKSYVPVERAGARVLDWDDAEAAGFFRLNHYFTRSWEEWQGKIRRGSSNPGYRRKLSMFFELNPDLSYLDTGEDYGQGYGPAAGDGVIEGEEMENTEMPG